MEDFISGPTLNLPDGKVVTIRIVWSDRLKMYEPIICYSNPFQDFYAAGIHANPYIVKRSLPADPPEAVREICQTVFGAMMTALANREVLLASYVNFEQHHVDDDEGGGVPVPIGLN